MYFLKLARIDIGVKLDMRHFHHEFQGVDFDRCRYKTLSPVVLIFGRRNGRTTLAVLSACNLDIRNEHCFTYGDFPERPGS